MTDLEDALRSQLAALPEPDLHVPQDLLPNLRRRQARRRVLAPAAVVSVVVAVLIAVPLTLAAHRSEPHPANPAQPGGPVTMTLTLHPVDGGAVEPRIRAEALDVLRARLRAAHLAGTVQSGDSPDTLRISGLDHALPASLLSVGALSLRQVFAVTAGDTNPAVPPGATTSEVAPSQCAKLSERGTAEVPPARAVCLYESVRCSTYQPTLADQVADNWSVSCSRDNNAKYLLRPAAVNGKDVRAASATIPTTTVGTGQWVVDLAFTRTGQQRFTDLTRATVAAQAPTNQVAMVVDGVVQSAPVTMAVIPGDASITGDYDQAQAEQLAAVLTAGPLPARVAVTAVSGR